MGLVGMEEIYRFVVEICSFDCCFMAAITISSYPTATRNTA